MTTEQCEICLNPRRDFVEREVLSGRQTVVWGADQLKVSYNMFWAHLQQHVSTEEDAETAKSLSEILDELIKQLHQRFKKLIKFPVEPGYERDIKACVDAINTCIMNIARLKRIVSSAPQIQIQTFQLQMSKMIEFIHTELPPEMQQKILQYIDAQTG